MGIVKLYGDKAMNVGNLMETAVVTLRRDSTLAEIYAVMSQYHQTDFPVVDENAQLIGMLYEEDIRKALKGMFQPTDSNLTEFAEAARRTVHALNLRAEEMMTPAIGWVNTETTIGKVAAVMDEKNVRCLPVFGSGRVVGIISERAIFMGLLKQGLTIKKTQGGPLKAESSAQEKMIAEKRRHPRKPASFKLAYKPVSFQLNYKPTDVYGNPSSQQARIARCINLSVGGMLIHVSEASQEDDVVDLAFEIPLSGDPIRRLARVTRSVFAPGGGFQLGLVFLALSVQETTALANYLKSLPD